jgi:hypothetical protein
MEIALIGVWPHNGLDVSQAHFTNYLRARGYWYPFISAGPLYILPIVVPVLLQLEGQENNS